MININIIITILVCFAAGVHAASYGAWKDSPSESFLFRRVVRELIISLIVGIVFAFLQIWKQQNYFIIYLSTYTIDRAFTEFYKLFMRIEPQEGYRIPTQIHYRGKVIQNPIIRLLIGLFVVVIIILVLFIAMFLIDTINMQLAGAIVGLLYGLVDASCGAYKDGSIEGFYWWKFIKSPSLGILGGFTASFATTNPLFLLFGTIAIFRMLIELLFKILSKEYVPGKFKSLEPIYPSWKVKRKIFLVPYFATWTLLVILGIFNSYPIF
jgi:hypothetical protein